MRDLDSGKEKIQKICDALRKETIEPARQEAREVIENAHMQASEIVSEAKEKAEKLIERAEKELEERKKVFHASLNMAAKQGVESLKQKIEKELFSPGLSLLIGKELNEPKLIAGLLNSFMKSMESKGIEEDFVAHIPKSISPRSINELLASDVLERLHGKTVVAGDLSGGVQIQLKNKKITIDISDAVVKELIGQYIRKDLRDLVFGA